MDNTLIDSKDAIKQCQVKGLYRATGKDMHQLERLLEEKGIIRTLSYLGIDQDTFYKTHYKTFDPYEALKKGEIKVFDDVRKFFDKGTYFDLYASGKCPSDKRPFSVDAIVSNSSAAATREKLDALDIRDKFNYIFAEFEKDKAKPTPYMAKQVLERLKDERSLNTIRKIINVGDKVEDIEFGNVLYDMLATEMGRKPSFNNYLIDRKGAYEPMRGVQIIKSFMEIQNE
jgi:phosphoglycolate phosphatase-like HAD superfamily hydrolase